MKRIIVSLILLVGVFGLLSFPPSPAGLGLQPFQGSTTSTICIVTGESGLTVHVVDANDRAVASATVLLNGTYVDSGQVCLSNLSGTTDSDGNVAFSVVGGAKYNVTVIPPRSLAGANVVASVVTAPPPTMFATATIAVAEYPVSSVLALSATILLVFLLATIMIKRRKSRRTNEIWKEKPK